MLEPVCPGTISYLINGSFYALTAGYGVYLWKTLGYRGFASIAVAPLVVLLTARPAANEALNFIREQSFSLQRKQLVNNYVNKYG